MWGESRGGGVSGRGWEGIARVSRNQGGGLLRKQIDFQGGRVVGSVRTCDLGQWLVQGLSKIISKICPLDLAGGRLMATCQDEKRKEKEDGD